MSRAVAFSKQSAGRVEYHTDWRIAGAIVALLAFMIAVPLSRRLWLSYSTLDVEQVVATSAAPSTSTTVSISSTEPNVVSETSAHSQVLTPWIERESDADLRAATEQQRRMREWAVAESRRLKKRPADPQSHADARNPSSAPGDSESPVYEYELERDLIANSVELNMETIQKAKRSLIHAAQVDGRTNPDKKQVPGQVRFLEWIKSQPEYDGIAFNDENNCRKTGLTSKRIQAISQSLRAIPRTVTRDVRSVTSDPLLAQIYTDLAVARQVTMETSWHEPAAVSVLAQILQTGSPQSRMELIEVLKKVTGSESTLTIVDRALFDFSATVRSAAIDALKLRTIDQPVVDRLLFGLRYPWAPVADHASAAIVELNLQSMDADLERLVALPDPSAPFRDAVGDWRQSQLVRVNHLGNCLLCHAFATKPTDPIRGVIPSPGQPLPAMYYEQEFGTSVRADVTYLKQDFSVMQSVPQPDHWPEVQRFDYFVRNRKLANDEVSRTTNSDATNANKSYLQRDAILRTLEQLASRSPPAARGK